MNRTAARRLAILILATAGIAPVLAQGAPSAGGGEERETGPRGGRRALRTEVRRLRERVDALERALEQNAAELRLAALFQNTAGLPEGLTVLRSAVAGKPELLTGVDHAELLKAFDAARPPMNRHSGTPVKIADAHAPEALLSEEPAPMMLWGPYHTLDRGRYLIVYRLKFEGDLPERNVCFLDVCHNAITFSGRNPDASETPAGRWIEAAVPLSVPEERDFEFRLWPHGHFTIVDRVYIYRLHETAKEEEKKGRILGGVMGAVNRAGTFGFTEGARVADALAEAGGVNGAGNPAACVLYRWRAAEGRCARETLDLTAGGGERLLEHGDVLEAPEK